MQFSTLGKDKWSLTNVVEKQSVTVPMRQSFIADDLYIIKTLTLKSQGIALLPTFLCRDELKNKDLVPVLPNWRTEVRPIRFIYPSQRFLLPKVKSFIEKSEGMF